MFGLTKNGFIQITQISRYKYVENKLTIWYNNSENEVKDMLLTVDIGNTNITTGIDVAQARGVTLLPAVMQNLPVYEYTPLQVKSSIVGYGYAEKKQVQEMVRSMLHLAQIIKPDDAADAMAIAITHGLSLNTRKVMEKFDKAAK